MIAAEEAACKLKEPVEARQDEAAQYARHQPEPEQLELRINEVNPTLSEALTKGPPLRPYVEMEDGLIDAIQL